MFILLLFYCETTTVHCNLTLYPFGYAYTVVVPGLLPINVVVLKFAELKVATMLLSIFQLTPDDDNPAGKITSTLVVSPTFRYTTDGEITMSCSVYCGNCMYNCVGFSITIGELGLLPLELLPLLLLLTSVSDLAVGHSVFSSVFETF